MTNPSIAVPATNAVSFVSMEITNEKEYGEMVTALSRSGGWFTLESNAGRSTLSLMELCTLITSKAFADNQVKAAYLVNPPAPTMYLEITYETTGGNKEPYFYKVSPCDAPKATPSSSWAAKGDEDPHGTRYSTDAGRAELTLGNMSDDELANYAYMNYDRRPSLTEMMAGTGKSPIIIMTAVKERIRWLSRKLVRMEEQVKAYTETDGDR